jgi:hypothetical protein
MAPPHRQTRGRAASLASAFRAFGEPKAHLARYRDMDRLASIFETLKGFAFTRPVAYGAPACAVVGALAGLAMQTGSQNGPYTPEMEPVGTMMEAVAEPISWPSGKVPDYVIGTDFLRMSQPPPIQMAAYDVGYEVPPAPEVPPYVPTQHGPATPPPDPDSPNWASERGDILDVSLPEDRVQQPIPMVLADAAATGMTTR